MHTQQFVMSSFVLRIKTVIDDDIFALANFVMKHKDSWSPTNLVNLKKFYIDP